MSMTTPAMETVPLMKAGSVYELPMKPLKGPRFCSRSPSRTIRATANDTMISDTGIPLTLINTKRYRSAPNSATMTIVMTIETK